jgi:nucleotide-binding universal stress UspA family protein
MAANHTIIVGVSSSPASLEAVTVACRAAKATRSRVHIVHVIEVKRSLGVNAELDAEARRGEQILRRAEEAASQTGVAVEAELLQARQAGEALVEEARNRHADVLAIGLSTSPVLGHFRMGRTAAYVLQHSPASVWIIRAGSLPAHTHVEETSQP